MSSSSLIALRREKQLQELLDGKNFKQALSLCEKYIKKGDKSEQLLITKINILLSQPEQARQKQGRRELNEVLERSPPISEASALAALDIAAYARGDNDPRIEEIWERAIRVKPHDEEVYIQWFRAKFWKKKWKAAQKASMLYMKNFPEKREPFFWNVICCELAGSCQLSSELDRKILRPLAFGFLSKATIETATKETLKNGRLIKTSEELLLLLRIYRSQNKSEDALMVLNSPHTGITSSIGGNLWELVRQKLELCELCNRWDEQWQFCKELLEDAHPNSAHEPRTSHHGFGESGDDWKTWISLVTAAININTSTCAKLTKDLIMSYVKPNTVSRNARLALLKFHSLYASQDIEAQDKLLISCQDYFSDYSDKVVCFSDLQPYIACLQRPRQESLLRFTARNCRGRASNSTDSTSNANGIRWITSEINSLKVDYFVIVSCNRGTYYKQLLEAFVINCLRLYNLSLPLGCGLPVSERQPGDDAAILAVMALMHLLELGQKNAPLRCIVILEYVLSRSKHNYDAMLILVRLHLCFGSGRSAIEHYSRLSIKNLQHASMSWILFTRISTIHPFIPSGARAKQLPTGFIKNIGFGIEWHKVAQRMNDTSMNQMLSDGKYDMLFDALATDSFLINGFAKFLLLAELHRVSRFSQQAISTSHLDLIDNVPLQIEETRDLTIFPDCEAPGERRFSDCLSCGPVPNHQWLGMQFRTNQLWIFLRTGSQGLETSSADRMVEYNKTEKDSLTDVEINVDGIVQSLRILCAIYYYFPQDNAQGALSDSVHKLLKNLCGWFSHIGKNSKAESVHSDKFVNSLNHAFAIPDWLYFHTNFMSLEICHLTMLTLDYVLSKNSVHKFIDSTVLNALANDIKQSIGKIFTNIEYLASALQNELREQNSIRKLTELVLGQPDETEDGIGQELRSLVDVAQMKEIAADMCASWMDALDGIHRLRNLR